jgi:low temperature requirement protein LtrA
MYFNRGAEDSSAVIAGSADPGRLGRSAYTYFHLPMVAGIIVTAVGDQLTIAHPAERSNAAAAAILGGAALFLIGHALFKRAVFGRLSVPRLVALAVLVALVPVSVAVPSLALAGAVTLTLAGVAAWDTLTHPLPAHAASA